MAKGLTRRALAEGVEDLCRRDRDLHQIVRRHGAPPMWGRRPGFGTLIQIVLEQQVSLASARAAFDRLSQQASPLTPETFLELDDRSLRTIGFSRQKTAYCRGIAEAIVDRRLSLPQLVRKDDAAARRALIEIRGIGPWTADVYLLMALRRPDVWPVGDLALVKAAQHAKRMDRPPKSKEMEALAESWRPWRAVAARILWQHYLNEPGVARA